MAQGILESIAADIAALNTRFDRLVFPVSEPDDPADTPAKSVDAPADEAEEAPKRGRGRPKGSTSKKVASKKVSSKKSTVDLTDLPTFQKKLIQSIEAAGAADPMNDLKGYIKAQKFKNSAEIPAEDREQFIADMIEHFTSDDGDADEAADDDMGF